MIFVIAVACALALASLGGGLYEFSVVDPAWPRRPERIWSAFDFIPKALAFERAAQVDEAAARAWTRRSRWRVPLDLLTCAAMLGALIEASQP